MRLTSLLPLHLGHAAVPDGAVVVVTGASSGIGEAVAELLAEQGRHLVLVARSVERLEKVAARCGELGCASVSVVPTDVSDDAAVAAMFAEAVERHGRVDAVAHCAGEVTYGRLDETSAEVFDRVLATNLSGSANVARHAIRRMRSQERGVLVLVGSLLGELAIPEMTPYVVSKWGVRALARQLVVENIDLPRVHVSHVVPGSVDTPIYASAIESGGATYKPPPPSISPQRVARVVAQELEHPSPERQTAWSNYLMITAFRTAPWAYDRMIGPVFRRVSRSG